MQHTVNVNHQDAIMSHHIVVLLGELFPVICIGLNEFHLQLARRVAFGQADPQVLSFMGRRVQQILCTTIQNFPTTTSILIILDDIQTPSIVTAHHPVRDSSAIEDALARQCFEGFGFPQWTRVSSIGT